MYLTNQARHRYEMDDTWFGPDGQMVLGDFRISLSVAQKMNAIRDTVLYPERTVLASHFHAIGIIDNSLHRVLNRYQHDMVPGVLERALETADQTIGHDRLSTLLQRFLDLFIPAGRVGQQTGAGGQALSRSLASSDRVTVLVEMLIVWLQNRNPALEPLKDLIDDGPLQAEATYGQLMETLVEFLKDQPAIDPGGQSVIETMVAPAQFTPGSLTGQLEYMRSEWRHSSTPEALQLLQGLDIIAEEEKPVFSGPGPAIVHDFNTQDSDVEPERFSQDLSWMPSVVLMAKNTYVWMDQLSAEYGRPVSRLDEIPGAALDVLADRGISGLWLIGIWERSKASRQIKRLCGNPDAAASAYALLDYRIADELGGEPAFEDLKRRAMDRGIRLASDMVPNHMGIDSHWVREHPEWFITRDDTPFPGYTFSGSDLSDDQRFTIQIEDHYYDRSDAAVVFKHSDHETGMTRYIYHGNDGTVMPWNDTAQLDFLNPQVREAVIQVVVNVARRFPIIRFDAAMTLAKRHFQRLWFPEPGSGGAIPSRAGESMSKEEFNAAMPVEFWREVVDRIAEEAPETLLLAEAFWLMEGYFVRTLGMHRVYNSAFMHMMRDEENEKYRQVIKNTIEFDPEILKRYVNFMNNPDEETAISQFGNGDKYFGVCVLLTTLPGLPMFGHGQFEGFTEKYGMEYRRAYTDEQPDMGLIARHVTDITPLLRRRDVFAEVTDFRFYDAVSSEGDLNSHVFAYSNGSGTDRTLIVYNNSSSPCHCWIKSSVPYAQRDLSGEKNLVITTVVEALSLTTGSESYAVFRDQLSGNEIIRSVSEVIERGISVELGPYRCTVYTIIDEIENDEDSRYRHLTEYLDGRSVSNLADAMVEALLQPVHRAFVPLVAPDLYSLFQNAEATENKPVTFGPVLERGIRELSDRIVEYGAYESSNPSAVDKIVDRFNYVTTKLCGSNDLRMSTDSRNWVDPCPNGPTLFGWLLTHHLGAIADSDNPAEYSRSWLDEWNLGRLLCGLFQDLGMDEEASDFRVAMIKIMITHQSWYREHRLAGSLARALLQDHDVQRVLNVNRHGDVLWFNKESLQQVLSGLALIAQVQICAEDDGVHSEVLADVSRVINEIDAAAERGEYQVAKLVVEL